MRKFILSVCAFGLLWAGQALAQEPSTCTTAADTKRLAGAARTSFLNKCGRDATSACEIMATEKKLHGAAKTSFTKKCVRDSAG